MYSNTTSQFYSSSTPQSQVFLKLKQNIQRLKGQRQQLHSAFNMDRNDLNNVEMAMNQLGRQLGEKANQVRQKEKRLMDIQKAINQTQKAYDIIVDTTNKLSNALENEANQLRNMGRK